MIRAAILKVSDSCMQGKREDIGGETITGRKMSKGDLSEGMTY